LYSIITTTDIAAQSTTSNTKEGNSKKNCYQVLNFFHCFYQYTVFSNVLGQNKPLNSRSQSVTSTENFDKEFSSRISSQFHQQILETDNEFDFDQNGNLLIHHLYFFYFRLSICILTIYLFLDSDVESYSFFKPSMVNTSTPRESIGTHLNSYSLISNISIRNLLR
jgi:hypothetical protein